MTLLEAILTVVVVAQVGLVSWFVPGDRLVRRRVRKKLVVTLKSGETVGGVLVDADRWSFVLRQAQMLGGEAGVPVDGELIVARADVAYIQKP